MDRHNSARARIRGCSLDQDQRQHCPCEKQSKDWVFGLLFARYFSPFTKIELDTIEYIKSILIEKMWDVQKKRLMFQNLKTLLAIPPPLSSYQLWSFKLAPLIPNSPYTPSPCIQSLWFSPWFFWICSPPGIGIGKETEVESGGRRVFQVFFSSFWWSESFCQCVGRASASTSVCFTSFFFFFRFIFVPFPFPFPMAPASVTAQAQAEASTLNDIPMALALP